MAIVSLDKDVLMEFIAISWTLIELKDSGLEFVFWCPLGVVAPPFPFREMLYSSKGPQREPTAVDIG